MGMHSGHTTNIQMYCDRVVWKLLDMFADLVYLLDMIFFKTRLVFLKDGMTEVKDGWEEEEGRRLDE